MKKRVILSYGNRELNHIPDKVRHDRATPTSLRIQVCGVRNRRIIRKIQDLKPFRSSVQDGRPESLGPIFVTILINETSAPQKLASIIKQPAIVAQILYTNLEP